MNRRVGVTHKAIFSYLSVLSAIWIVSITLYDLPRDGEITLGPYQVIALLLVGLVLVFSVRYILTSKNRESRPELSLDTRLLVVIVFITSAITLLVLLLSVRPIDTIHVDIFIVAVGVLVLVQFAGLYFCQKKQGDSFLWHLGTGLLVSLISITVLFLVLEAIFRFIPMTDSGGYTHADQVWGARYWNPINSLGYRDYEWNDTNTAGATRVLVLGDSFGSGKGINNYDDTFPGRLNQMLGDRYAVMNASVLGYSTEDEFRDLKNYPYQPDIVILQYLPNDIEGSAARNGIRFPVEIVPEPPTGMLGLLVERSYVTNFFYYQYFRVSNPDLMTPYLDFLGQAYNDPDTWQEHQTNLENIIQWCEQNDATLFVVTFPLITQIEETTFATTMVEEMFNEHGVTVISVAELIDQEDPADLIVNPIDAHPNEYVHNLVAIELYKAIIATR